MSKGSFASLRLFINFINLTECIPSTFDIHFSLFDIRFFDDSFSIKLSSLQSAAGLPALGSLEGEAGTPET
jgi:hypothetical protein